MPPETEAAVKSPEISDDAKRILREFATQNRHSSLDRVIEFQGNEVDFTSHYKRPFNNSPIQDVFQEGQFTQVVFTVDPIPGVPFSHREAIKSTPQDMYITERMILHLIRDVKKDDKGHQQTQQKQT